MRVTLDGRYARPEQRLSFYRGLLDRARLVPGARRAGLVDALDVAVGALDPVVVRAAGAHDAAAAGVVVGRGAVPHVRAIPRIRGRAHRDQQHERLHQFFPVLQVVPSVAPPSHAAIVS